MLNIIVQDSTARKRPRKANEGIVKTPHVMTQEESDHIDEIINAVSDLGVGGPRSPSEVVPVPRSPSPNVITKVTSTVATSTSTTVTMTTSSPTIASVVVETVKPVETKRIIEKPVNGKYFIIYIKYYY